jgi:hypothetical protein
MPELADRVKETSTTSGYGTITLGGAAAGFQTFSAGFLVGDRVTYCIVDGTNWEIGIGTLLTSSTISRDNVIKSVSADKDADGHINCSASSKDVFATLPACCVQSRGRVIATARGMNWS